jgi:hypothetical protein
MLSGIPAIADTVADVPIIAGIPTVTECILLFMSVMLSLQLFWRLGPCNGLPTIACVPDVAGIAAVDPGFPTVADFHTVTVYNVPTFATNPAHCWHPQTVVGILDVDGIVANSPAVLSIHLVYGGGDSSIQRARLVNGGEDSSLEGETHVFSPVKSCPFMYPLEQNR